MAIPGARAPIARQTVEVGVEADGKVALARVIAELKFAPSTSEATRQIKASGVKINGDRVDDLRWAPPGGGGEHVLQVGAGKIARLVVTAVPKTHVRRLARFCPIKYLQLKRQRA